MMAAGCCRTTLAWVSVSVRRPRNRHTISIATIRPQSRSISHKLLCSNKVHKDEVASSSFSNTPIVPNAIRNSLVKEILPSILPQSATNTDQTCHPKAIFLLGVSGGCDSIGLLHAMMEIVQEEQPPESSLSSKQPRLPNTTSSMPATSEDDDATNRDNSVTLTTRNNLWNLDSMIPCEIHVVHFDHQLRGADSDGDRRFVQELCCHYQLPFQCFYWNDYKGDQKGQSTTNQNISSKNSTIPFSQDAARRWRQTEMEGYLQWILVSSSTTDSSSSSTTSMGVILTAHHRDDSMESWMLKFLRGAHISNLHGMSPVIKKKQSHTDGGGPRGDIYYARPLLNVHKTDIIDYLQSRGSEWREDESNQSDKYLRNRIRNELIPLMSDLVGGDQDTLYKRLDHLSKQSNEVNQDLQERSRAYLLEVQATGDYFPIPTLPMGIVQKNALYQWIQDVATDDIQLSYERLEMICKQIEREPDNNQWILDLGSGWMIQRKGTVLMAVSKKKNQGQSTSLEGANKYPDKLKWTTLDDNSIKPVSNTARIEIAIPRKPKGPLDFVVTTVEDLSKSQTFRGAWWDNQRTPIPVSQFLRGQKVPLHRRAHARTILLMEENQEIRDALVVAVFVESRQQWMIHKDFVSTESKSNRISISLPSDG